MSHTVEPRSSQQRGVTLVETMVVLAIIGVLGAVALPAFKQSSHGRGPLGYARTIEATMDEARVRATGGRRWQRLVASPAGVLYQESLSVGMAKPISPSQWTTIKDLPRPNGVRLQGTMASTTFAAVGTAPSGFNTVFEFAPDGSGTATTLFLCNDTNGGDRIRITTVRASSSAYVFSEW